MSEQAKSIVAWVIIGLIAGWLASIVVGSGSGLIGYIIAGLIGSVVGGFLAQQFCQARECSKAEHQGDAVCARLRESEAERLRASIDR